MIKTCVVCGGVFQAPPSSKKITCSRECSRANKRRTHLGKRNVWNAEKRKRLSRRGRTPNLLKGSPAAQASPRSGAFESNANALIWTLRTPDNRILVVRNLNHYIREHPEMFDGTPEQAGAGIRSIRQSQLGRRSRRVTQWKGWELIDVTVPPELYSQSGA